MAGELPCNLASTALKHVGHAAFETAPAYPPFDFDAIAVHGRTAAAYADVDVFRTIVRDYEAVAVGMKLDSALNDSS